MHLWKNRWNRLGDEIQNHIDLETKENIEAGMSAEDARRAALKKFGNVLASSENSRDIWGWLRLERLLQDVSFSLRMLAKSPGFTAVAVLTLALGIGANASIFTLLNAVLMKDLPVADSASLLRIGDNTACCVSGSNPDAGDFALFPTGAWKLFRENATEFDDLAAIQAGFEYRPVVVRQDGNQTLARSVMGEFVSGNYFRTFGLRPAAGELLTDMDDRPEAPLRAVMSYETWRRDYSGDRSVIGSTFWINTKAVTIAGIAPNGFYGDRLSSAPPDFFLPIEAMPQLANAPYVHDPATEWLYMIGRIKPGTPLPALQEKLSVLLRQYMSDTRPFYSGKGKDQLSKVHVVLTPGGAGIHEMRQAFGSSLRMLMAASALLLLIACANIANLLLARSMARKTEISLRTALGAGRGRIVRQLLTESLVLALLSGTAGLLVAYAGTRTILVLAFPQAQSLPISAAPSGALLAFAFLLSVFTGTIFGVAPAWITARLDPADTLRSGPRSTKGTSIVQRGLIVVQAALSLILLVGAGLFSQSLNKLQGTDLKLEPHNRYVIHINPQAAGYAQTQVEQLYRTIEDRFHQLPGVEQVGISSYTPMEDNNNGWSVWVQGEPDVRGGASEIKANSEYFESVGTRLIMGRGISSRDTSTSPAIAVVNQAFVKSMFKPGNNPIGRRFGTRGPNSQSDFEIVGVAEDTVYTNVRWKEHLMYFVPLAQRSPSTKEPIEKDELMYAGAIVLKTTRPINDMEALSRQTLSGINPNLTAVRFQTFEEQIFNMFNYERMIARLTTWFGLLALLLATVGLYGVTAFVVARRTNEIGIRIAIGARRSNVIAMVMRDAMVQVALGLAIGIPAAFFCKRFIETQLYEMKGLNLAILALSALVMLMSTALAAFIPARRASSIEPTAALRIE